jgi:hypothetical protein
MQSSNLEASKSEDGEQVEQGHAVEKDEDETERPPATPTPKRTAVQARRGDVCIGCKRTCKISRPQTDLKRVALTLPDCLRATTCAFSSSSILGVTSHFTIA